MEEEIEEQTLVDSHIDHIERRLCDGVGGMWLKHSYGRTGAHTHAGAHAC